MIMGQGEGTEICLVPRSLASNWMDDAFTVAGTTRTDSFITPQTPFPTAIFLSSIRENLRPSSRIFEILLALSTLPSYTCVDLQIGERRFITRASTLCK